MLTIFVVSIIYFLLQKEFKRIRLLIFFTVSAKQSTFVNLTKYYVTIVDISTIFLLIQQKFLPTFLENTSDSNTKKNATMRYFYKYLMAMYL